MVSNLHVAEVEDKEVNLIGVEEGLEMRIDLCLKTNNIKQRLSKIKMKRFRMRLRILLIILNNVKVLCRILLKKFENF